MLTDRYAPKILGVISCFDRVLIQGTLPDISHAAAMTRELNRRGIRIFDFTQFAQPMREAIRERAERMAEENGMEIEFIRTELSRLARRILPSGSAPLNSSPLLYL